MVKELNRLIKDTLQLWARLKQLRVIKKEVRKRNKLKSKLEKQDLIVSKLLEEYQKEYLI